MTELTLCPLLTFLTHFSLRLNKIADTFRHLTVEKSLGILAEGEAE